MEIHVQPRITAALRVTTGQPCPVLLEKNATKAAT
jgi:hypothetical protein